MQLVLELGELGMHLRHRGFNVGRYMRIAAAHALGVVTHVFEAVDARDDARLVVRFDDFAGLLRFPGQLLDAGLQLGRRIGRGQAGLLGLPDGLLDMADPLLDFVCL